MLVLREYQERSLEELEKYLTMSAAMGAKMAFVNITERPYRSVAQLPGLPYVCLRVPTGGGKTLMACHALGIAADKFLRCERAVCLWLVPSNAIREQTLNALKNRSHPYRQAVEARFSGPVTVMDLTEALYVQRGTIEGETLIIVSTLAALRVTDIEGRKVYESAGALQHHFSGLPPALEETLEKREDKTYPYSLANVLRLHRPVIIMDEAHNARTSLSFETLARLSPSCIIEFTATPETKHNPEKEIFASNVLHHVSAAELKAEEMVKLPIKLQTRPYWKEILGDAVRMQRELEKIAGEEEKQTGEYIRPVVLLQAQSRSRSKETLTVEVVKASLMNDFRVPKEQIAIATGDTRELDGVDVFDCNCPLRFIITVQALKEGWDCAYAYILCSVADISSRRAVEQILGRILRLPNAAWKKNTELNCAYAFVASPKFIEAANSLKDALIENGFERLETADLIAPLGDPKPLYPLGPLFDQISEVFTEEPDLFKLPAELSKRVSFDPSVGALVVTGSLSHKDEEALVRCFIGPEAKEAVKRLARRSRGEDASGAPASAGGTFQVPYLVIRLGDQLELFEDQFLDFEWNLNDADDSLSELEFPSQPASGQAGELDVQENGTLQVVFLENLQRQVALISTESGWTLPALVNWLDRQILHPDLTQAQATLFIHRVLEKLMNERQFDIDRLARQKFALRDALALKIDGYRRAKSKEAFNQFLFATGPHEVIVSPEICFSYSLDTYAPNWYYEGRFKFNKHFFPRVGELKSDGEEFECAVYIDQLDEVEFWVRNLEKRRKHSFWLPTSTDAFYPDFVVKLKDGRTLVLEYKGEHLWSNDDSKEKRAVGELWAERSGGECLFVMPKGKDWTAVADKMRP